MIKNDCYDVYKAVNLAIDSNKQYSEKVPSQHVSDLRQEQLRKKTTRSLKYQMQFNKITERLSHEYGDEELAVLEDEENGNVSLEKFNTVHIHQNVENTKCVSSDDFEIIEENEENENNKTKELIQEKSNKNNQNESKPKEKDK